jgi:3-oxoacyl-[acyl-carrier protein] reductase
MSAAAGRITDPHRSKVTPDLTGRVAMVTGGAGSLGRAVAVALRDHGARVVAIDGDARRLAELVPEIGIYGAVCDRTDQAAVECCIARAWEEQGPISVLVNAAGLIYNAPLIDVTSASQRRHAVDVWRRVIDANLTAVFLATVNVADRMVSARMRGVVVNFSSVAASGNAGQSAYSAAKAGVNAATAAWAKELGPLGIRFVAIAPGFVDTPSTRAALPEPILREWTRRTPLRRLGAMENVVSAVMFAIANEHLTGKVIEIDGGLTL